MPQIAFIPFSFPALPQVGMCFTSRRGGVSEPPHEQSNLSYDVGDETEAVDKNRQLIKERFGLQALVDCTQVHGDTVVFDLAPGTECKADGLAVTKPKIAVMAKTADCQPILLAHETGRFVAALHVGWRGNVINFPASGVAKICEEFKANPRELFAVRGPSLGPNWAQFLNFHQEFGEKFAKYFDHDKKTVDLWRLTKEQLVGAGLRQERVYGVDLCTREMEDTFYSYRRDKTTGRQAGIVWLKK